MPGDDQVNRQAPRQPKTWGWMGSEDEIGRNDPQKRRPLGRASLPAARISLAVGCLAVVGGCSIVEPPAPPQASTSYQDDIHLSPATPVAVRHLTFAVTPPKRTLQASLEVYAAGIDEVFEDLTVTVVPDDNAALGAVGSGWHDHQIPGSTLRLDDYCSNGCRGGLTVILRGVNHGAAETIRLYATLQVAGTGFEAKEPLGTTLTIAGDADPTFSGSPSSAVANIERAIEVSTDAPKAHLDLRLQIDAASLVAPLGYPLVGSLTLRATGTGESATLFNSCCQSLGSMTVNGAPFALGAGGPVDVDWLRWCSAGRDCDVAVGIDVSYQNLSHVATVSAAADNRTLEAVPSSFTLAVNAQARLEAFDDRTLQGNGLTLTSG